WDGNKAFITLQKGTVPLKNSDGIRDVYDNCGNCYAPISSNDQASLKYYVDVLPGMFWFRRIGQKLFLYGVDPLAKKINYEAINSIEELSYDDQLPIQAGFEPQVIDMILRYFAEKSIYDNVIDGKDDVN